MAGTTIGGHKAKLKNLAKDPDFYAKIGAKGGRNGHTGGFAAATSAQVKAWGAKGGRISRRKKTITNVTVDNMTAVTKDDVTLAA